MTFNPNMFHIYDIDVASKIDQHLHLGEGSLPIKEILQRLPHDSMISIETQKNSREILADFERDAQWIRT
jgi:sugar phosphate isomerase/epimerase